MPHLPETSRAHRYHLLVSGGRHTQKQILRILGVSPSTVRSYRTRLRHWASRRIGHSVLTYEAALIVYCAIHEPADVPETAQKRK